MSDSARLLYSRRLESLISCLAKIPADVVIVACVDSRGWEDIAYLTGFTGSSGVLMITRDEALLYVDDRYLATAEQTSYCRVASCSRLGSRSPLEAVIKRAIESRPQRVAYVGRSLSHLSFRFMEHEFTLKLGELEYIDVSSLLSNIRRHKSDEELAGIKEAIEIAAAAFMAVLGETAAGMSEREFAARLEYGLKIRGCDFFDPVPVMVASGPRTALPHFFPTDRRFAAGDLVMVDFGARRHGYVSDLTRMISIGRPTESTLSLYSLVVWAQTEAADLLKAGVSLAAVDSAAREVLKGAGLGVNFVHGVGHGIGLEIHETPGLNKSSRQTADLGDVVTLEPGFYKPGSFGMRLEDDYLVGQDGAVKLSASFDNGLYVV